MLHLGAHHGQRPRTPRKAVSGAARDRRRCGGQRAQRDPLQGHPRRSPTSRRRLRAIAEQIDVGTFSQVIAPMLWEGESIGTLYVIRQPAIGFGEKRDRPAQDVRRPGGDRDPERAPLQRDAEALRKVEQRTAEVTEALDHQTAISDVLRVISQSPTDVAAGVRGDPRQRVAPLRQPESRRVPLRRPAGAPGGDAQLAGRGDRGREPAIPVRPIRDASGRSSSPASVQITSTRTRSATRTTTGGRAGHRRTGAACSARRC